MSEQYTSRPGPRGSQSHQQFGRGQHQGNRGNFHRGRGGRGNNEASQSQSFAERQDTTRTGPQGSRPYQQFGRGQHQGNRGNFHGRGRGRNEASQSQPFAERQGSENRERNFSYRSRAAPVEGPISLETNHFELSLKQDKAIHYDVTITPTASKQLYKKVMQEFVKQNYAKHYPSYDGSKSLYSSSPLFSRGEVVTKTVKVCNDNGKEKEFNVKVKFAGQIDLTCLTRPQESAGVEKALQCLEIVLKNAPSKSHINFGRFFFSKPDNPYDLPGGLTVYNGFAQSVVQGDKLYLNVDTKHWAFIKELCLIDLIDELKGNTDRLNILIKGVKIRYEIPNIPSSKRIMSCNRFTQTPDQEIFDYDNTRISVANYYKDVKNTTLKYQSYPCVSVGQQNNLYPPEFCTILEGQVNKNITMLNFQTSKMITLTSTKPFERKMKIVNFRKSVDFNNDSFAKKFGITVSENFVKLQGRVIKPPELKYNDNGEQKFLQPAKLTAWGIICIDPDVKSTNFLEKACKLEDWIRKEGKFQNMQIAGAQFQDYIPLDKRRQQWHYQDLITILNKYKTFELVVVVLSDKFKHYQCVKQAAEIKIGVLTQCLKSSSLEKLSASLIKNLLLKINSKLNGINRSIDYSEAKIPEDCIFMGADVTHPNNRTRSTIPSVAAVTASCGPDAFRYKAIMRLQQPTVEIISDLDDMAYKLLQFYTNKNGKKPKHVIFFRDGVSDGDFNKVVQVEVKAIHKACQKLDPKSTYKPKVTFCVVQKRHHTRFFPTDMAGNAPAGTIVDTVITTPNKTDYYLLSHTSMRGVARPTRYRKLYDDVPMDENDLKNLSYLLCFMFSRCTTPVSYPAPTYNAHLAAERAKSYLDGKQIDISNLDQSLVEIHSKISDNYVMHYT